MNASDDKCFKPEQRVLNMEKMFLNPSTLTLQDINRKFESF